MKPAAQNPPEGRFITFEGIDGAGKSTHIDFISNLVRDAGKEVVVTREPGGTALGEKLRALLLHEKMNLETEALLMFAARREHINAVIAPALSRGAWVISDRFTDASFAYQGGGRGLSLEKLAALEAWVHPHLQPDMTFLFDIPPHIASARLEAVRTRDKFESEAEAFFQRVRAEYLRRAAEFPSRFRIIDSTQSIPDIQDQLQQMLRPLLS
ncbi:dTMP kinase [Oxalobacter vibrioformis]|uniref:Thymidylate kinase n=1 Tax=Oxalobacter vibrioformis TaxID=933080 RepID=A0A9E9LZT9_9BURK|nr:dTMP kinase [Oxalobacter vibrioformis]WAW10248.1 dTMP kinase [Oxalobacter vibrioformis]